MNLNKSTALTLRVGVVIGMVLIVAGLVISMTSGRDGLLYAGILILILSPFLSVIVSFLALVIERDWYWAMVAAILLAITSAGVVLSL